MITFRQLEILSAVVEHGNFRRCAEALGISQVSVSEHMKSLEVQLGVELFLRSRGGPVQLTESGHRAAALVPELLLHLRDFMHNVAQPGEHGDIIRIAMHPFMMRNLGQPLLMWNDTQSSELQLVSQDRPCTELYQALNSGELDAALFYALGEPEIPSELIAYERLGIFVQAQHPLTRVEHITPEMLGRTPSVSLSRDKPLRKVIDAALLAAGVHPVRHAVETAEFGLILSSLHRGMGFTCMFHASREEVMQTAGLVEIDFAAELPAAEIRCAVRRGQRGNPVVRRALKMITENLALRD